MNIDLLGKAKDLVAVLEQGDTSGAEALLDELAHLRETHLFNEFGRITRQLHDSMSSFELDDKIAALTEHDIPNAKERLQYVITMTEQAADQTLTAVERLLPISQALNEQAEDLNIKWGRFLDREMPLDEFKTMSAEIASYFRASNQGLLEVQSGLNDILMAQSFQDITGQIIRKVIDLVHEVESSMVNVITITAQHSTHKTTAKSGVTGGVNPDLPGPVVPGVNDKAGDVATSQVDVDDLLSSLGF